MGKKQTSISVDEDLWRDWTHFVLDKYGSARKLSEALEDAMRFSMKHKREES